MDLGDIGLNGLTGLYGSMTSLKQERSSGTEEDEWRSLKIAKNDAMLLQQQQRSNGSMRSAANNSLFSDGLQQQQMLSFSSPKSEAYLLKNDTPTTLPYFQQTSSSPYNRNYTGNAAGSLNGANMHGVLSGLRGHFTPSQWVELEHQALIYKYIDANVPIPSHLLLPIRRVPESAGFTNFSTRPDAFGWGAFHMGFANNTDPEPGRCRRTDGKKWRCSRDAVPDQKYCERHMNRGRHRSRKPVEGQSGHSAATSISTNNTTTTSHNAASSASVVVMQSGSGNSNGLAGGQQHQVKNLQPGASNYPSAGTNVNRILMNKDMMSEGTQDTRGFSMLSSAISLNSKENTLSSKQQISSGQSSRAQFGLVSTSSLLNPSQRGTPFPNCRHYGSSQDANEHKKEVQHPHLLRHFMDDWPKMQPDQTQLSISIPMASSDFNLSSTSSPTNEKNELSIANPLQMGLGLGYNDLNQQNQGQANQIPITWETSLGGPLGEVLQNSSNNNAAECKNNAALNLMTEGWDNSPRLGSSPTGVLQKATFCSLSNSSAGSSPRAETNRTHERSSLCNDLLGSALARTSSLPYL